VAHGPITLSLVVPAYNQRARSTRAAGAAGEFLAARYGERAELIVVDDGSVPAERLVAAELPARAVLVTHPQNLGKGGAIRSGMLCARGDYVVFTDSDLPFGLEPLPTTLAWLEEGADIVIGDRLHPESQAAIDVTPTRQASSIVYTWMVSRLCGLDYPDTQCGYKGLSSGRRPRLVRAPRGDELRLRGGDPAAGTRRGLPHPSPAAAPAQRRGLVGPPHSTCAAHAARRPAHRLERPPRPI
jgi:glycosyltransferase involved in cell wall biosynthesis